MTAWAPDAAGGRQGTVAFYSNLDPLGSAAMPRQLTDCFNSLEGVLIGDAGLQLGQVGARHRAQAGLFPVCIACVAFWII